MPTIMLTRKFSGFANREDALAIGNHEHEGNATAAEYDLPEGYSLDEAHGTPVIRDPLGIECWIGFDISGNETLISRAGNCPDATLHRVA